MASGDGIVDDKAIRRKSVAIIDDLAARADASTKDRLRICRAMTQQRSDSGQPSMPQKFVRLVGCHDPNARRR